MKKMLALLISMVSILFLVGCGPSSTVQNIDNSGFINDKKITSNDVKNAIRKGAMAKGWMTKEIKSGLLESQIRVRGKHLVIVDISYDSNGYKINYKNSENLGYNPESNTIHQNYNKWIASLEQNINYELSVIGVDGNNTQSNNLAQARNFSQPVPIVQPVNSLTDEKYSKGGNIDTLNQTVYINSLVAYSKTNRIAQNIKTECKINQQLSDFIKKYAAEKGLKVEFKNDISPKDLYLKIQIDDAISQGSAFAGHAKYTSISGILIRGNKSYGSFKAARVSGGGAFGQFKGSCDVLGRTVDTLGKDVSTWLYSPIDDAYLGDTGYIR